VIVFGHLRVVVVVAAIAGVFAACASLPPAQQARDVRSIAGKWEGAVQTSGRSFPATLTIREDGTWEAMVLGTSNPGPRFVGTVAVLAGQYRWKSEINRVSGTYTLHEGGGERVLVARRDDGQTVGEYRPAK
jgi:hypothetical protein